MGFYKSISKQVFTFDKYSIVPLRMQDRYAIMKWRNEQIYHLRQSKPLNKKDQDAYFDTVVSDLFLQECPNQLLFSYLQGEECIGYGGIVHINWVDRNAEISFIMDTDLEKEFFEYHWVIFLNLIEKVAFGELNLYKLFTYAYDIRPKLYKALEKADYLHEATLKDHCLINGNYKDVLIHSKFINI